MEKQDQFLMIPYKILNAWGYQTKDGKPIKMSSSDKIIYCYLKSRFRFFKSLGKEYFDTQQSIADFCCLDLKTTGLILRKFIKNEITTIYKKPYNNYLKNVYTNVGNLSLLAEKTTVLTDVEEFTYLAPAPEDFVVELRDVSYSKESDMDMDSLDIEWEY